MKTILKLVIAAAILNAVVRGASAAWDYYQLRDSAQQALLFGSQWSAEQIHQEIMRTAMKLEVPLEPENLSVRLVARRRMAEGSYTQAIEFFPSYSYPVNFSFAVESAVIGIPPGDEEYPPRPRR